MATLEEDVVAIRQQVQILDALEGADGVAAFLTARGVRGCPGSSERCPLARYLAPFATRGVSVDDRTVQIYAFTDADEEYVDLDLPRTVWSFVAAFDNHDYPELEES
jgi:hypothetical protein